MLGLIFVDLFDRGLNINTTHCIGELLLLNLA